MADNSKQVGRRTILRTSGAVATAGVVGLAGCSSNEGNGSSSDDRSDGDQSTDRDLPTVVHGATEGGTTGVITSIMKSEEFDIDNGIELQLENFTSPPQVQNQLVLNEDVPTGYMGSIIATRMYAENKPTHLVGPYMYYHAYLVAQSDGPIQEPEDLRGKKVSYANEAADAWLKFVILLDEAHGVHPDEYEFVQSAPPAALSLLDRGEVDAILSFEPILTKGLVQHDFDVIFSPREAWRQQENQPLTTVDLAWTQSWYENNASAGEKLANALLNTQQYLSKNIRSVVEENREAFGFESQEQVDLGKQRLNEIYPTEWNEEAFIDSEVRMVEKARDLGLIDAEPTEAIFNWVL